jgi:hypothetical protein
MGFMPVSSKKIRRKRMKRLILGLAFVLFSTLVFANDGVEKSFRESTDRINSTVFGTVCIDGYKFAFMRAAGNNGVALVQIFQESTSFSPMEPIKCKN